MQDLLNVLPAVTCFAKPQHLGETLLNLLQMQVIEASDVLFLFAGGVQGIKDIIASNKSNLLHHQILVVVLKDGAIEDYQASSSNCPH